MFKYFILIIGIAAAATSGLFIQWTPLSKDAPFLLAVGRLMVAALVLSPFMIRDLRRHARKLTFADFLRAAPGGILLGLHLGTWNIGVANSTVANATLIVNLNPVAMPILLFLLVREKLTRGELVGSGIALLGVSVLVALDPNLSFGAGTLMGDLVCVGSMVLAVGYLVAGKFRAKGQPLFLYLVPLYLCAAATCLPVALYESTQLTTITQTDWLAILGLGLIPTVIGHSAFNYSMVHVRSQVFSIGNLGQFVVAATLDWIIHAHAPALRFYPAAALIVAGAVVVVLNRPRPVAPGVVPDATID